MMRIGLRIAYAAAMLFALFVVIGGKIPAFGRYFLPQDTPGKIPGDLYRLSELERFREEIPVVAPRPVATLEDADILTIGDSFFNSTLASDQFANELGRKKGLKVFNLESQTFFEPYSYPLSFLESIGYKGERRRILILESVERSILDRRDTYNSAAATFNDANAVAFKLLKNNDVEFFFKNNLLVHPLEKWLKNVRFDYFRIADKSIGAYSEKPDMLFYQRDIDYGREPKPDAVVDAAAASIARLSDTLKRRYNLELIYVPVPNKYSIYHGLLGPRFGYDDFLPRLSRKLTGLGVRNIDLYRIYTQRNRPEMPLLYYATDTHYTPLGKDLLVEACARMVEGLRK